MDFQFTGSKFLQYLMRKAEAIQKEKGKTILSANILFYAALCYYKDVRFAEDFTADDDDRREMEAVNSLLQTFLDGKDNADFVSVLNKNESYMDNLTFMQYLEAAKQKAKVSGKTEVPCDVLLSCILDKPTKEIAEVLHPQPKAESEGPNKSDPAPSENATPVYSEKGTDVPKSVSESVDASQAIAELTQRIKEMHRTLRQQVIGQDNAISLFLSGYFQAEIRKYVDKNKKSPQATFLFAGPPGVGKTYLAEKIAEVLGLEYMRFDMSEYAESDAVMELCGTNPSFHGNKEGGLTNFVRKHPKCVLLFDEIEKAHIFVIHLFLQVLDAGRLRDTNTAKEVDFSQTIIFFTTNAGRKLYEDSPTQNLSNISRKAILKALETDVDPKTGRSAFPAAICSRFATGNVVMFNHMRANDLQTILKGEIARNTQALQEETGIRCSVPDTVCSCVLFAEGGLADARTVRSRAGAFLAAELYELYRLASNSENHFRVEDIKNITFDVVLPTDDQQIVQLFQSTRKINALVFSPLEQGVSVLRDLGSTCNVLIAEQIDQAQKLLAENDIDLILCNLFTGIVKTRKYLNIEDIDSEGRSFLKYACDDTEIPVYVLCGSDERPLTEEEEFSLFKMGVRGSVTMTSKEDLKTQICAIAEQIHYQDSINILARANKVLTYNTTQSISEDVTTAQVLLYDLALETAVDADDADSLLNRAYIPDVCFDDVIGAKDAKNELAFFINYLKNPRAFVTSGFQAPKGILFYGPPGTGKTMLAKAVAGECGVAFISAEGNQFLKKYVGEGEEAIHRLFSIARKYAPTVLFIDEIDAIGIERTGERVGSDSVLTALLAEMDGFKSDESRPVFVLAATNFQVEPGSAKSLDSALLRRFDRKILIDLPNKEDRIRYMRLFGEKKMFDLSDGEIENIAVRSTGMSLAELENVFNYALRIAAINKKPAVDDETLEEAFETFIYGEEKQWDSSEITRTARHEVGHALVCWYYGETPSYLTIVARGNHGGYMQHDDCEKHGSFSKRELLNRICVALGGRAAELVFYGDEGGLTTGAASDLQTATQIARNIICRFGMDDSLGLASVSSDELTCGEIASDVRRSVNSILQQELQKARMIVENNRDAVDRMVDILLQKNHLNGSEINMFFSGNVHRD